MHNEQLDGSVASSQRFLWLLGFLLAIGIVFAGTLCAQPVGSVLRGLAPLDVWTMIAFCGLLVLLPMLYAIARIRHPQKVLTRVNVEPYVFEVKWGGFRALIEAASSGIKIWSRNGHGMTS